MALSNIFNEPRREITETVVGLAAIVGIGAALAGIGWSFYLIGKWLAPDDAPFATSMVCVGAFLAGLALIGIHSLGEAICNELEQRQIRLRP